MAATENSSPISASDHDRGQPGTSGIWTFVFIDMIVFALFFAVFVSERHRLPEVFTGSQKALDPRFGLLGTLLLIASSYGLAEAVHAVRSGQLVRARPSLDLAVLLGLGFVANELAEYSAKLAHMWTPPLARAFLPE